MASAAITSTILLFLSHFFLYKFDFYTAVRFQSTALMYVCLAWTEQLTHIWIECVLFSSMIEHAIEKKFQ